MKKVLISFIKYRETDFLAKCRLVYQSMNGNVNFPNPEPAMIAFLAKTGEFDNAITNANTGDRTAIAHKNAVQVTLIGMMHNLAMYVNTICKGNVEMLVGSGFTLTKDPVPVYLETPVIRQIKQAQNPGGMVVTIYAAKGSKSILFQIATNPVDANSWTTIGSSKLSFEFTNLVQGQKYWFRVVAIGSKGQLAYSEEVIQYVMQRTISNAA